MQTFSPTPSFFLLVTINTPLPYSISPPPNTHIHSAFGAKLSTFHYLPRIFSLHFLRHSQEKKKMKLAFATFLLVCLVLSSSFFEATMAGSSKISSTSTNLNNLFLFLKTSALKVKILLELLWYFVVEWFNCHGTLRFSPVSLRFIKKKS